MPEPLIILENVARTFMVKGQTIKAVDDVNLTIPAGEMVVASLLAGRSGGRDGCRYPGALLVSRAEAASRVS